MFSRVLSPLKGALWCRLLASLASLENHHKDYRPYPLFDSCLRGGIIAFSPLTQ